MTRITLLIILLLKEIADNGRKQIMLQIKWEQCLFDACTHWCGCNQEANMRNPTSDGA